MKNYLCFLAAFAGLITLVNPVSGAPFVLSDVLTNKASVYYFGAVGDVNGDGKPDLVALDTYSDFIVLTNAGNGIFISNATYKVGSAGPFFAAIADVNGDGRPDVITLNDNNTVTLFTNAGGGLLVSNATYAVGNNPIYLLVTDINGDGKPDIITANSTDGTLTILTNGGGPFHVADTVLVVNSDSLVYGVAAVDLKGDGKMALVAGDSNDGLVEILTNAGGGIFVSNAVYASGTPNGSGPASIVAADFNNDGKMDVACGNADGSVTVFTNAGNGLLAQSQSFTVPGYTTGSYVIMAGDVDGDSNTDLLVPGQIGNTTIIATMYNRGTGATFITNYVSSTNVVNSILPVSFEWNAAADINGDGKPDIMGSGGANGFIYAFTNGVGSFPNILSINVYSNINFPPVTNITVNATSPSGAMVSFTAIASNWTGSWPVTNTPPSGAIFPLGATTVTSSSGYFVKSNIFGSATTNFTVTVVDTNPPVITLLGANPLTNFVDSYVDPGATASDPIYGDLTSSIKVSGNLNTNAPGTYTVNYSVTDPAGNRAMASRTVAIIPPPPPLGVAATSGNQTALFWLSGSDTNFVVQMTTNLASGVWVNVTNGRPLSGIYVSNIAPAAFFRLAPQ